AFGTTEAAVKLTLTAYIGGFAMVQLVCGPLSDAYGRRPVTIAFLVLYLVAAVVSLYAPTVEWMTAARALQGAGAAVGVALSRAIVRDLFVGQASARVMNAIAMMLSLGPAISPTIGGVLLEYADWTYIFGLMVVYGVVLIAVVLIGLPETNIHRSGRFRPARLFANYRALLGDWRFMQPTLVVGLSAG